MTKQKPSRPTVGKQARRATASRTPSARADGSQGQAAASSPDSFLTFRLDQLNHTALAKASRFYKDRLGLNVRELRVIRVIGQRPGLSAKDLAEATFLEQTLLSKHLRKLVSDGYVRRASDGDDARRTSLRLTAKGEKVRADASLLGEMLERDFLSSLTQAEIDILNSCIAKLQLWGGS